MLTQLCIQSHASSYGIGTPGSSAQGILRVRMLNRVEKYQTDPRGPSQLNDLVTQPG